MRKKLLSLSIALILALNPLPTVSRAAVQNDPVTSYRSSYNEGDYFEFTVSGDNLIIKGVCSDNSVRFLWIKLGSLDQGQFEINANEPFEKTFSLAAFKSDGSVNVNILSGKALYGYYYYIFDGSNVALKRSGSSWSFDFNQEVLGKNAEADGKWKNPGSMFLEKIDESVVALSRDITSGAKCDYERILLIHNWVAENIYYDMDYFYNRSSSSPTDPAEILKKKYAVCTGYANLTQALCNAQNIPCITVRGYSLGLSTSGAWTDNAVNSEKTNHAWNEAWADGRWVTIDTTWDSGNEYENGNFTYHGRRYPKYFDISKEQLSKTHKTVFCGFAASQNTPSQWAQSETAKAISLYLVPYSLQSLYGSGITRRDFCALIVSLFEARYKAEISKVLSSRGLGVNISAFSDCSDSNVLSACALGIAGGKGNGIFDPSGFITRQEAAAMLQRAANALGIIAPKSERQSFSDSGSFESWSAESIFFISSLIDNESGKAVMGGVGNGSFSPDGIYTREQSYCSILRLFNLARSANS